MKRTLVFSLLALATVVAASLAYAAIPSANGVISACIDTGGDLKLIDAESGAVCSKNKQLITWNQQGPAGPAGPVGPAGPSGPAGAPGADGVVGRVVVFDTSDVSSPSQRDVDVECPTGTVPIGGGGRPFAVPGGWTPWNIALGASYPTATGWFVTANEVNGGFNLDWVLRAYVICAAAS